MKPQDILRLLKRLCEPNGIYESLAKALFMSQSEVHAGVKRAEAANPHRPHYQNILYQVMLWPYAEGQVKGYQFSPLYKSVPQAALHDQSLYEFLALYPPILLYSSLKCHNSMQQ